MRVILLGIQGSGKGTQAARLAESLGVAHVDVGELLRERVAQDDALGKKIKALMDKGKLVPDSISNRIVKEAIEDAPGWILDGYPRDVAEAEYLDGIAEVEHVIFLEISDKLAIERLSKRRVCGKCHAISDASKKTCPACGGKLVHRDDDKPAAITKRLEVFHDVTEPLTEYYRVRGILHRIDASGSVDKVFKNVLAILE
jgi:adenylate kinase